MEVDGDIACTFLYVLPWGLCFFFYNLEGGGDGSFPCATTLTQLQVMDMMKVLMGGIISPIVVQGVFTEVDIEVIPSLVVRNHCFYNVPQAKIHGAHQFIIWAPFNSILTLHNPPSPAPIPSLSEYFSVSKDNHLPTHQSIPF